MKKKALFVLDEFERIYSEEIVRQIKEVVDIYAPVQTTQDIKEHPEILSECQLIFSGCSAPKMDEEFLAHAPKLEYVFYGAEPSAIWCPTPSGDGGSGFPAPGR
ncbi:MAG: hypothetical protein ACLRVT_03625 [Oscillospiraceae bacterium]